MRIAVLRESVVGENRVALVPENATRLARAGHEVRIERSAGLAAGFPDAAYQAAGAAALDAREALEGAALVALVQRPSEEQIRLLPPGSTLVGLLAPHQNRGLLDALAARGVNALAMERVPRITRAQSMDALSSQATVAGYKAVLLGAAALPRILPMLTTAAGTLAPAKVFVIGAGRRRPAGHRHRPAPGRGGLGLRRAPGGEGAGAEPGRDVRRRRRPWPPRARAATPGELAQDEQRPRAGGGGRPTSGTWTW